jgi:hypothetical protein
VSRAPRCSRSVRHTHGLLVPPLKLEVAVRTDLTADSALPTPALQRGILVDPVGLSPNPAYRRRARPAGVPVPVVHQTRQRGCGHAGWSRARPGARSRRGRAGSTERSSRHAQIISCWCCVTATIMLDPSTGRRLIRWRSRRPLGRPAAGARARHGDGPRLEGVRQ